MNITVGRAEEAELPLLLEIEKSATPSLLYLAGVSELFLDYSTGELVVAYADRVPAGFGRFSVLCDGAGWLETLRVSKEMQGNGLGKAIWKRYIELCKIFDVSAVRMYTGERNVVSKGLAEKNGLSIAARTNEALFALTGTDSAKTGFRQVTEPEEAAELIGRYAEELPYFCQNRTYFANCERLWRHLTITGQVYVSGDTVVTIGARFLEKEALHIGLFGGDYLEALEFAKGMGTQRNMPKLTCMVPSGRDDMKQALRKAGFTVGENEIIMLEKKFR